MKTAPLKTAFAPLYRLLEFADLYALNQRIGKPTTDRFRTLLARHMAASRDAAILDIGCGIGNYRASFGAAYTGVDINPGYIAKARATLEGRFEVMDCTRLDLAEASFDEAVTIATTHHLDDEQLTRMTAEALRIIRPGGHFHVIDAILPVSPNFTFKRIWFGLDRGRFPRRHEALSHRIEQAGAILERDILIGPLHDTIYLRVGRR